MIPRQVEEAIEEICNHRYSQAWELLRPLADAGDPYARCNIASLYQFGFGVEVNAANAAEMYQLVGALGIRDGLLSALAYHNLAVLYITGAPGFVPDPEKTAHYEELAKKLGFPM